MLEICSIASGSNGNCYYIGNETDAIVIDCGIFFRSLETRAGNAGIDIKKIRAVLISHEHSDHVRGVKTLAGKLNLPVYFTPRTYEKTYKRHKPDYYKALSLEEPVEIFGFYVHTFKKYHDAISPVSFRVEYQGVNIGVMTDIGVADVTLCKEFSKCQAAFLESNYDEQMLENGPYPKVLKDRVASNVGHLSNSQAFALVRDFANENLTHLIFSHVSQENNTPEKVLEKFSPFKDKYSMCVAPRFDPSEKMVILP